MKNDARYWGSVRFYKHLILIVTALLILVPSIGLLVMSIRHLKLKREYYSAVNEQILYINQLEEEIAIISELLENIDTDTSPETEESQCVQEQPEVCSVTNENVLSIPFSVDPEDWRYILVNDQNPLPAAFQPVLAKTQNGKQVDGKIRIPLEQMLDDAKTEGFDLIICSAYRDYKKQDELVRKSIEKQMLAGYDYTQAHLHTKKNIALVGTSEHHTGLAVDLVGVSNQVLDERQADTPEAKWLEEHAHEYGFILRYPKGKEEITGIVYESWHFRYVGKNAAGFMKENQLCLEEFIELIYSQEGQKADNNQT